MESIGKYFLLPSVPDLNSRGTLGVYNHKLSCALSAISAGLFLRISRCLWVKDTWTMSWYVKRKTYTEMSV